MLAEPLADAAVRAPCTADATNDTDALYVAHYRDLRRLAHARLRGGGRDALLDTTVLVHESYLRLAQSSTRRFPDTARFLVYAGRTMRSIIVDLARRRLAARHGGDCAQVTLHTEIGDAAPGAEQEVIRVHEALQQLARVDPRMARVVEMKYFGGLTEAEIAEGMGVAERTVRRDWEQARLFLAEALQ